MVGTIASVGDRRTARLGSFVFLLATALSAAMTGALVGLVGQLARTTNIPGVASFWLVISIVALALAHDVLGIGVPWPYLRRQVSAGRWRHGPIWAAAVWGLELGVGLLTHVPAKILYALLAVCLLVGTPLSAVLYGGYGFVKGLQPLLMSDPSAATPRTVSRLGRHAQTMTATLAAAGLLATIAL